MTDDEPSDATIVSYASVGLSGAFVFGRRGAEFSKRNVAMFSLLPDEVIRAACQMACYGFAAFTAMVAFLLTPRW